MSSLPEPLSTFDLFLSHGSPDKDWVRELCKELEAEGLRAYLDEQELKPGDNWVMGLSEGLERSRFLVLILSRKTLDREWVVHEWTSHLALRGPKGHSIIPV